MSQYSFSQYFSATVNLYKTCIIDASKALFHHWPIIPLSILLYFAFRFLFVLFGDMGFGGGFLIGFASIVFITYYYGWLASALEEKKFSFQTSYLLDYQLFFHVISVAFVLWIARLLIQSLLGGMPVEDISLQILQLAIVLLFNCIPETLYIHRYESIHALTHAASFTRDNWIEWFLPFVVVLLPIGIVSFEWVLYLVSNSQELLPAAAIISGWMNVAPIYGEAFAILGLFIGNWFMLFRGFLYKELESGSRRQRLYRSKM